jgi:hypothetical protein
MNRIWFLLPLFFLFHFAAFASQDIDPLDCGNFHPYDTAHKPVEGFPVFDSLVRADKVGGRYGYLNIPESEKLGLGRFTFVNQGPKLFDEEAIRNLVATASAADPSPVLFFDIEDKRFPYDIRHTSKEAVNGTITYFGQIADWVHAANPQAKLGFYGAPVVGDERTFISFYLMCLRQSNPHWRDNPQNLAPERDITTRIKTAYAELVAANDYMTPLAAKVDIIFPAFYTWRDAFLSDPLGSASAFSWHRDAGWRDLMLLVLENARRFGKPVYPFIWAQYHNMLAPPKGGSEIPIELWRKQIAFVRQHADGAALFGVGKAAPGGEWRDFQPWWREVVEGLLRSRPDRKSPAAPRGLNVTAMTPTASDYTQVLIEWRAAEDDEGGSGVEGYRILRDGVSIADTAVTSFRDTHLEAGSTHVYSIVAYDFGGNQSPPSQSETIELSR